ncbi:hypothetical protein EDB81DRAFT_381090 [Dactylonectria macrodidyma]|uniref:SprT-like domain-containing protein n=1 Tax=Dactylonectria macrodidyma TaxID=307937 RepID=A0A9P9FAD9_9HYPO|nr:hypothetical protein EDB81DRAFT_381090 [Dactylonectria macrodidyma]
MASPWVDDGGRSHGATVGREPYYMGSKRRVSHSDGGDGGDTSDYKRTKFAASELGTDGCRSAPSRGDYAYGNDIRYENPRIGALPPCGPGLDDCFNHPSEEDPYHHDYHDYHDYDHKIGAAPPPLIHPDSMHERNITTFFVIRECSPTPEPAPRSPLSFGPGSGPGLGPGPGPSVDNGPVLSPPGPGAPLPGACNMERTQSGLSISSDTTQNSLASLGRDDDDPSLLSDLEAARLVRDHVAGLTRRRRCPDSQHGRILKVLISPKPNPRGSPLDWPLDNDALRSIFLAANELFFASKLTGRVAWDWSHPASAQYEAHIVGTTALRRSREGEFETLIVLSSPILKDTKYNRRLLISTFLHEMIHSFLFVTCGLKAGKDGGHTEGFRQIANTIDAWVGRGYLRLGEMEADLEQFREHEAHTHEHERENGAVDEERRSRGNSPWRRPDGRDERHRDDYYPAEPRPRQPHQQHQPQHQPQHQYQQHRHQQQLQQPQQHYHQHQHQHHHPSPEEWQWQEREGFFIRVARGGG